MEYLLLPLLSPSFSPRHGLPLPVTHASSIHAHCKIFLSFPSPPPSPLPPPPPHSCRIRLHSSSYPPITPSNELLPSYYLLSSRITHSDASPQLVPFPLMTRNRTPCPLPLIRLSTLCPLPLPIPLYPASPLIPYPYPSLTPLTSRSPPYSSICTKEDPVFAHSTLNVTQRAIK